MKRKQINLADGRYLIFYSFDDESAHQTPPAPITADSEHEETSAQPVDGEERDV